MELLLNLVWVLLAALALGRWSRGRNQLRSPVHLIALICLLALLFPVISATDDLHAMRPEIEDSTSNRRCLKHACGAAAHNPFSCSPALLTASDAAVPYGETGSLVISVRVSTPTIRFRTLEFGRAPPSA